MPQPGLWRVAGAGLAFGWLALRWGSILRAAALSLAHVGTLLLDPVANGALRIIAVLWTGSSAVVAGGWGALLLVGMDAGCLAAVGAAAFEPALRAAGRLGGARTAHDAWVRLVDSAQLTLGGICAVFLRPIAAVTEWFLVGDLVLQRIYHTLHPCTRLGMRAAVESSDVNPRAPTLAVIIHGKHAPENLHL
jgi:hypothetical protein